MTPDRHAALCALLAQDGDTAVEGKLCECGCGTPLKPANKAFIKYGIKKGDYRRFVRGHHPGRTDISYAYAVNEITGCWDWLLSKEGGYGRFRHKVAHVFVWERANGPKPKGLDLDHLCRNRGCVNPGHLELVTRRENVRRGASPKLSVEQVAEIRSRSDLHVYGIKMKLSVQYGIGHSQITRIINGVSWEDVKAAESPS